MFNHPTPRPHPSNGFPNDSFSFPSHQPWTRFDLYQTPDAGPHDSPQSYAPSSMDWTPTSDDTPSYHHANDEVELDSLSPIHVEGADGNAGPGGVGRLVAHFENKGYTPFENKPYAPPTTLPSSRGSQTGLDTQQSLSKPHFDQLSYYGPGPGPGNAPGLAASPFAPDRSAPVTGLGDSSWASYGLHPRVPSPLAATNPSAVGFGTFQETPRVTGPVPTPMSAQFGGLDIFASGNRVPGPAGPPPLPTPQMAPSPMLSPTQTSPPVAGTPGFEIWRPPGSTVPVKPVTAPTTTPVVPRAGAFIKPPVPSTPKPNVSGSGNQFILEFNPTATKTAKGKAPAKPARLRAPPAVPPPFSPEVKQEPVTPGASDRPSSSSTAAASLPTQVQRPASTSARAHTGSRPSREQVPAEAWEQFKSTIRTLYLDERRPLKEVMAIMAEKYNFQATPKMYKTRFSQWGFVKNNTEDEVKRLLSMKFQRDAEGKVSEFVRNGRVVNLGTYLKRKGVTEYDLIDFELPADLPAHVKCRTPTPPPAPDYLRSPDLLRAQELVVGNMRKAFLHCRQIEVETELQVGWPMTMVWGADSSDLLMEANFYFEARDADMGGRFLMRAFKLLEADLKKLSPLGIKELLLGMVQRDPGMMTALCKYLAAYSTTNLERSHPLRQIFTCLYEVQQKHGPGTLSDLLWGSTPTIAEELEAIYSRRHPYVARTWIDLALFYNHVHVERLEKVLAELRTLERSVEQRHGLRSADLMSLRYSMMQLLYVLAPQSEASKQAAVDMWSYMRFMGTVFPVRDERSPNVYCYHTPIKVDPSRKRCRRRYDLGVTILEKHLGVKVMPYFEEDFHTTAHAHDAQEAWSTAVNHVQSNPKFFFI
ncbi:hypothetical protein CDD80_559 [Ophiocordyceps camponoti-rufipedis]|uniref:Clr5 domain-containing protein n=1 Tax=Ophiocordyceps camponoti-rufipedis TaxID=2004952 RepID=A0A2C5XCW2_9HYPO|nr:hypothetical protein CDD80_559 [Ophiocordyceps camponoti-rufipedis]